MADAREFMEAAADATTAYAHYLLRTSANSVRIIHLYEQVIGCVARRQLTPAAVSNSLDQWTGTRGAECAATAGALAERFFTDFASMALTAFQERWETDQAQFAKLAAGETTPAAFRLTNARQEKRAAAARLSHATRLWFELLSGLDDLQRQFAEEHLLGAIRSANPIGYDDDVIELAAPAGATTSRVLWLENTLEKRAVLQCAVSDVRRADGVGPAFAPDIAITPSRVVVDGNGQVGVSVSLRLDDTVYEPGAAYVGALHIRRDRQPHVAVPLRITVQART